MNGMTRNERALYIATYAAAHGALMGSKALRGKPIGLARLARTHALAALEVHRPAKRK